MKKEKLALDRAQLKSSEGEFLYELENSYELSPKLSALILQTAKECLLRDHILKEGQIEVTVVGIKERSGKLIEKLEKKRIIVTIDNGQEDREAFESHGRIGLRQIRIQRITDEALDQGGVFSQEDLAKYLSCNVRTIQRDIKFIKSRGIEVITRGVLHNIGRGQTHKVQIVSQYLEGKTFSEIKRSLRHSDGSIKHYLTCFVKVLMSRRRGILSAKEISVVTGLSENLVSQYLELIKNSEADPVRYEHLEMLIERSSLAPRSSKKKDRERWSESGSYDWRQLMNVNQIKDRYVSINKRNFRNALIHLLENNYKILGSRKVLELLADDIEDLHREFFPNLNEVGMGEIVFRTTKDDGQRQNYGKKTEDYASITVILPLITEEDIERRIYYKKGDRNSNYEHREARDIETMVRLTKSTKTQGGLISGAELSVLLNRSLSTIRKYLDAYHKKTGEILPLKGYVLDQGSLPTHKGIIISLYEQGILPADIVLKTGHIQESVDRYIKQYDQIKLIIKKGLDEVAIKEITGRSMKVVREYIKLYYDFHPRAKK